MFDPDKVIKPFIGVHAIEHNNGYIVWRRATGDNVELLHIRTYEKGHGTGKALVKAMLLKLQQHPPYYSVFGFTRTNNDEAHQFYVHLGFELTEVTGIYADGDAVVFSQSYQKLMEIHFEN